MPVKAAASSAVGAFNVLADMSSGWLYHVRAAARFQTVLAKWIPWTDLSAEEKSAVQEGLSATQPEQQLLINALYVTLVAGFEEFLRSLVRRLGNQITDTKSKYEDLEQEVMRLHIRESAKLLRKIDSPPDYITFDSAEVCRRLGTCSPGGGHVELNADALADVESLIKLKTFFERTEPFGCKIDFDVLGRNDQIQKVLRMPRNAVRETAKLLSKTMDDVARMRNRIAHTGGNASDVTEDILRNHTELLKAIAAVLDPLCVFKAQKAT